MLVRAARRRVQRDASRNLQPAYEQLHLPWLCPAQFRYDSQIRKTSTATASSTPTPKEAVRRRYVDLRGQPSKRYLASAAGAGSRRIVPNDYIPFEQAPLPPPSKPPQRGPWLRDHSISDLRDFSSSNPLIINNSLATAPKKFRAHKGIPGDLEEIHLTLIACLRTGNIERGGILLQRMSRIYTPDSPELIEAHAEYMRVNVENIIRYKDQNILKDLQKWFEIEIRLRGIEPDATIYALLLKASLQIPHRAKMERTVRRYMELALQAELRDEALSLAVLSEAELGLISQVSGHHPWRIDSADRFRFVHSTLIKPTTIPLLRNLQARPCQFSRIPTRKPL